ncbi:MAG: hypothetical protein NC238_05275 [Dehalobacter sp.]|nr:hypothetical protein [Dehalobacter sp.]
MTNGKRQKLKPNWGRSINENNQFLGIVKNGQLQLLQPENLAGNSVRLTRIQMQEAQTPESVELDLTEYEGKAIMIRGQEGGEWIFSSEVIDQAGPILTAVVKKLFSQ